MKYKSLLERDFALKWLKPRKIKADYEVDRFSYVKTHFYIPDWKIKKDVYLETKGKFTSSDRSKTLAVVQAYPKIKIIMVFANAYNKLSKKSKTTYADWCDQHNIPWLHLGAKYFKGKYIFNQNPEGWQQVEELLK